MSDGIVVLILMNKLMLAYSPIEQETKSGNISVFLFQPNS